MIRTSEAYEIVRNDPIHVAGISAGQVIKREKKKIQRYNGWKITKFDGKYSRLR